MKESDLPPNVLARIEAQDADRERRQSRPTNLATDHFRDTGKMARSGGGLSLDVSAKVASGVRGRIEASATGMNKLEASWAAVLETRRLTGELLVWRFESLKLRLAKATWYTPDFWCITSDGAIEFHEVKGHWRDDARVKWKGNADQFPEFVFRAIQRIKGEWQIETYARKAGGPPRSTS